MQEAWKNPTPASTPPLPVPPHFCRCRYRYRCAFILLQVKMVLIPKREEFSEAERIRLWWSREDYACFRQVLIDWKRANAHRISQSDNILSINLSDIDDEESASSCSGQPEAAVAPAAWYNYAHDEAAAAADAIAAAAAVAAAQAAAKAAKAMAAAAVTAQANAAATAAAAAAATAVEVAAMNVEEVERERQASAAARQLRRQETPEPTPLLEQQEGKSGEQSASDAWEVEEAVAKAMAAAVAEAGGGISGEIAHGDPADDDGELSDIAEGHEGQEEQDMPRIGQSADAESVGSEARARRGKMSRASFTMGIGPRPDFSSTGGANGTFPLRRALTFGETGSSPPSASSAGGYGGNLKAVPLSEAQATAESLRAWRKNFNARCDLGGGGGGEEEEEEEEDRGRALSLQQQTRNYAKRGRATALVMSRTKWASDVGGGFPGAAAGSAAAAAGGAFGRPGQGESGGGATGAAAPTATAAIVTGGAASDGGGEMSGGGCVDQGDDQQQQQAGEKQLRNLSDQDERSVFLASPVMAAFERERAQAAAREAELEDARVARAASMVKAAMAEKLTSASSGETPPSAGGKASGGGGAHGGGGDEGSVVELGLNDAPGSAAAASAAGLRIATDGVSNLSLRSKDSVENLQELGEHSWGPLPLSSSA